MQYEEPKELANINSKPRGGGGGGGGCWIDGLVVKSQPCFSEDPGLVSRTHSD